MKHQMTANELIPNKRVQNELTSGEIIPNND